MIEVGIAVFIVAVLIIIIWVLIAIKRMRHKVFALFLIGVVLFLYFSATFVFKDKDIDFKTTTGIITASNLYFNWLGSAFTNLKTITMNAVKMDWESVNLTNASIG